MKKRTKLCLGPLAASLYLTIVPTVGAADSQAWLGVATAPLEEIVAAQLDLPEGVGAAVKLVVPDSPAAAAGIAKNDVLFEFEGEPIRSPEHLSELVGAKSAGAEVSLAIIHRGDKKDITVKLGERPEDLPRVADAQVDEFGIGEPGDFKFEIMPFQGGDLKELEKQMEKLRQRMEKQFEGMLKLEGLGDLPGAADIVGMTSKSVMLNDGNGTIKIETKNGETTVTAKDADGKVLFEGPANTEEERAKMPAGVREKVEQFESSDMKLDLRGFNFGTPKMRVPDLKPGKKVEPGDGEIPPAEKDGKKIKV